MFLVYLVGDNLFGKSLDSVQTFAVQGNNIVDYYQGTEFSSANTPEEAVARFNDIVKAAASDQKVYDLRKDIGYWDVPNEPEKKPTTKRAGRKPAAEKAAPEHNEPAPKK